MSPCRHVTMSSCHHVVMSPCRSLPQTPVTWEGINNFVEHAVSKFGAARLSLEPLVRHLLSAAGVACTLPAVRSQGTEARPGHRGCVVASADTDVA
jgi:hypothetical protein